MSLRDWSSDVCSSDLVSRRRILRLLHSRRTCGHSNVDRIGRGLPRELELLLRRKWRCGRIIGDIEIWKGTEYTLLFLVLNLRLRDLFLRHGYPYICHLGSHDEYNRRNNIAASRTHGPRVCGRCEARVTDRQLERPGGYIVKGELSAIV